jgi:mRNA interferase MazF
LKPIARGEIYFSRLDPVEGREQGGRRPVLVVSSNRLNRRPLLVTVITGTDAKNVDRDYSTNVRVPASESGLPLDTVFLAFQVRSIDPVRFADPRTGEIRMAGRLSAPRMREVEGALRKVLDL